MRTGDIRSIPLAVWPFVALWIADIYLRMSGGGPLGGSSFVEITQLPGVILTSAPLLFAAAVAFVAPTDRRILLAAALIAVPEAANVLVMAWSAWVSFIGDEWQPVGGSITAVAQAAGLVLLGVALGGLRSRVGRILLIAAVLYGGYVILRNGLNLSSMASTSEQDFPLIWYVTPFFSGIVTVAWAFLLGTAIDNRRPAIALGSALLVLPMLIGAIADPFFSSAYPLIPQLPFAIPWLQATAWIALIYGAFRELPTTPRREVTPVEELAPAAPPVSA